MIPGYKPYSAYLVMKYWLNGDNWPALLPSTD